MKKILFCTILTIGSLISMPVNEIQPKNEMAIIEEDISLKDIAKDSKSSDKLADCEKLSKIIDGGVLPFKLTSDVCTIAKPRKDVTFVMKGAPTKSPLINTALFSFEKGLNLGEGAGVDKEIQKLRDELINNGIDITAIHTHWLDTTVNGKPATIMYMHWADSKLSPEDFAKINAKAWKKVFKK